ncbi:MAG: hypothetical protein ACLP1X_12765 [Polyangiaceae bacterium]
MKCWARARRIAGLALAILAPAGCAQHPRADGHASSAALSTASAAVQSSTPTVSPHGHGWAAGGWYAYGARMTTTVGLGNDSKAFDFDLDTVVQAGTARYASDRVTLFLAAASPRVTSRVPEMQGHFDQLEKELTATGCFATYEDGRLSDFYLPRGLSPMTANIYRALAAALQFSRGAPAAETYTADEYDTTGQYVAEYRFDPSHQIWERHKSKYVAILGNRTASPLLPPSIAPRIVSSAGSVRLTDDGRPSSVEMQDELELHGAQAPVSAKTTLSLRDQPAKTAPLPNTDWDSLIARMDKLGANDAYAPNVSVESMDQARIKGLTFETALAGLEALARTHQDDLQASVNGAPTDDPERVREEQRTAETSRLFIALSAILREHPETIPQAVHAVEAKSPASQFLLEALSSASTPATQTALVGLITQKTDDPTFRSRALLALSRAPRPDAKAVHTFEAMLDKDPFSEQALLSLGTFARRFRDLGDTKAAADIGDLLVGKLGKAQFTLQLLNVLRAITNSGYVPAIEHVMPYVTDNREEVRAVAVRSFQSMLDPRADRVLADRLQNDSSGDVRIAALAAAKVREVDDSLAGAVKGVAAEEQDPRVRYRAVELLVAWAQRRSDLRPFLAQVAERDGEARIRDLAHTAL